jgi:hypothetical protein
MLGPKACRWQGPSRWPVVFGMEKRPSERRRDFVVMVRPLVLALAAHRLCEHEAQHGGSKDYGR